MSCEVKTICPYCGVGCGIVARVDDQGTVSVSGDPDHPANYGRLCSKGSALAETLDLEGRALFPTIGSNRASWDDALNLVASTFLKTVKEHGPDSVAFYVSGQCLTEDYYVANKLMKGFIGSANIDTNSRLCMASSVAGHRRAFGSDTVPGTYEDFELADLVLLVGSNLAWCHPVLYQRIAAAKAKRPEMKVVLIDPRATATADLADVHLAIKPDSDVALFNGLLAHLAQSNAMNWSYVEKHTVGFDAALSAALEQSLADLELATGLEAQQLLDFFQFFEGTEKVVTAYSQGVNQSASGTDKVNAIINCHLATGRIGRPGMGPFSLTGQPNAMGGREVGGLANMLAAHMNIEDPIARNRVQRFWDSPRIAKKPGLKAVDMFRAVADGRIKAIWIMSTNPVVSMPDADFVRYALKNCPFVVVSDIVEKTDTTACAHVVLPALGWGEKDGTVTNSERRISRQRHFLRIPGDAKPDWWKMAEVGKRMGFERAFTYTSAAEIFAEHAALSALDNDGTRDFDIGRYADISEISFDSMEPFQWPKAKVSTGGDIRFFADGGFYTESGKANFVVVRGKNYSAIDPSFPLTLNTGRIRDQWHTMTRTGKSLRLSQHIAEPFAEIHPKDAEKYGIRDAELILVSSAIGKCMVRALITFRQQQGSIFVPMHWNDQWASAGRIDTLVHSDVDALSGQPALKSTNVKVEAARLAAYGFAVVGGELKGTPDAAYWAKAKVADGYRLELGFAQVPNDLIEWARANFNIPDDVDCIGYVDEVRGQHRIAFFNGTVLVAAMFTSRDPVTVARQHLVSQLGLSHKNPKTRYSVVSGRPGLDQQDTGAIVCACFSIGINQIDEAISNGCSSLEHIGEKLKAGTNCGSCRAEIKALLQASNTIAAE